MSRFWGRNQRGDASERHYYIGPDGQIYDFSQSPVTNVVSFSGWGMPNVNYVTQRFPNSNGISIKSHSFGPRRLQYVTKFVGDSRCNYWDEREKIVDFLRPSRQTQIDQCESGTLVLERCNERYMIPALFESGLNFTPSDKTQWKEWNFDEQIIFLAPDPCICKVPDGCEDPSNPYHSMDLPIATNNGTFYSTNISPTFTEIIYDGTCESKPIIEICSDKPITDIQLSWRLPPVTGPLGTTNPLIFVQFISTDPLAPLAPYYPTLGEACATLNFENLRFYDSPLGPDLGGFLNKISIPSLAANLSKVCFIPDPTAPNGLTEMRMSIGQFDPLDPPSYVDITMRYKEKYLGI